MMVRLTPFQQLLRLEQGFREQAAALPARQETKEYWSGIGFSMGGQYYVAPMGEVTEVLPEPRYTVLPGVKGWVRGVANVRGRLLPVMDLCAFLGLTLGGNRKSRRILVMEHGSVFAGLTVDAVLGMQHFAMDSFNPQGEGAPDSVRTFVHGSFQREHNWLLFSPHVLATDAAFLDVVA